MIEAIRLNKSLLFAAAIIRKKDKIMRARSLYASVATAALLGLCLGAAASAATFTIDPGHVSIIGEDFCLLGDCTLKGVIKGGSFDLDAVGDTARIDDLFDWKVLTTNRFTSGVGGYGVSATLNFSQPSVSSASNNGYAGFLTLGGVVTGGILTWTNVPDDVIFAEGYKLAYSLDDTLKFGFGNSTQTGGSFTLTQAPSPVPLPASALLLLAGVGGLGSLRRRNRKAA